ncbi:unnamed protein product [Polarella glacialis]|uniref:Cyclic nucleotide-binding domain-containing protein n=1 Tax=Polarella glacialis TaxID=89957 RepID=A0A813IHW2_POLGL|nr:unnamed protein product [Polarella glacialis]
METGVPADNYNHNNNSLMEQQAEEQDAVSKERGEQDKSVDELELKIDFNMQPARQEKGHDGQTGKVPADTSQWEQQAGEQDAVSKERGEQDKSVDEMELKIDINMQPARQEKGHDGQTGKVPADTSPWEQQAGEQDAVSKERGEQGKTVDELEPKIDFNMQLDRQEKGHDGQIKVDEQDVPARQEDGHNCDLPFGFIRLKPAGCSPVAESPGFELPGVGFNSIFNSPPLNDEKRANLRYGFSKAKSKSMNMSTLNLVAPRRRFSEVGSSGFMVPAPLTPSPHGGRLQKQSSKISLQSESPDSPRTPFGSRAYSRAVSSAYLSRASSRQDLASDGETPKDLMGLHPVWRNQANMGGAPQIRWAKSKVRGTGTLIEIRSSEEQNQQLDDCLWGHQAWEVLGLLMISWDLLALPMQVFQPFPGELLVSTTILTTLYWTCDVPFTFLASQHSDGARQISVKAMTLQCASSWLLFDSIMVLVNWLAVVLTIFSAARRHDEALSHIHDQELLRFVSSFRVLRVPRFIFKSKAGFLALLEEYGGSQKVRIMFGIAGMLVFIVLTNHLIACAFYGIATMSSLDTNWAYFAFELTGRTSLSYRYATSMHWAMGLFHTSGSDILPTNSQERIFVQFVIIWNLTVFSTLIASMGNALQQLRELNEERTEQFAKVRRYFSSNNVQPGLAKKAWAALSLAAQKPKRRTQWDEIKILQQLPKSLQAELHQRIRGPILSVHPFFSAFDGAFTVQMRQVYQLCISEISIEQGQELFHTGEASTQMYFVLEGTFCYHEELQSSFLSAGEWVGEPVLWMSWKHTGCLLAKTPCAVLAVKSKELQEILGSEGGDAGFIVREYAMQFTRHCHNHAYRLTDVGVDVDTVGKLVEIAFEPPLEPPPEPPQEDLDVATVVNSLILL